MVDSIVNEVREIRELLSSQFDFDIRKIVADARRRQASSNARVVSFATSSHLPQPNDADVAALTSLISDGAVSAN
jgi:hypothetical protein